MKALNRMDYQLNNRHLKLNDQKYILTLCSLYCEFFMSYIFPSSFCRYEPTGLEQWL